MIQMILCFICALGAAACAWCTFKLWMETRKSERAVESFDRLMDRQLGVNEAVDLKFDNVEKRFCKLGMKYELKKKAQIDLKKRCDGITTRMDGVSKRCARIEEKVKIISDIVLLLGDQAAKDGGDTDTSAAIYGCGEDDERAAKDGGGGDTEESETVWAR